MSDLRAILLIRDQDDQPSRRKGLKQARDQQGDTIPIVIGLAIVEREAWVLSGFNPRDDAEQGRLDGERQALGFHPCERSHDLTAGKDDQARKSPKRVLRQLAEDDRDRERECWMTAPLEQLQRRGVDNGLAEYLGEIRDRIAPLFE